MPVPRRRGYLELALDCGGPWRESLRGCPCLLWDGEEPVPGGFGWWHEGVVGKKWEEWNRSGTPYMCLSSVHFAHAFECGSSVPLRQGNTATIQHILHPNRAGGPPREGGVRPECANPLTISALSHHLPPARRGEMGGLGA